MQPYGGGPPPASTEFRANRGAEFSLEGGALFIRYQRSDRPTDRVPLAALQELEIIRTVSVPGMRMAAVSNLVLGVGAVGVGGWGLWAGEAWAGAFLLAALAPLGYAFTFMRDMFLLVGWDGRRRTEKFSLRRRADAERFVQAAWAAKRRLDAPRPGFTGASTPPKPS